MAVTLCGSGVQARLANRKINLEACTALGSGVQCIQIQQRLDGVKTTAECFLDDSPQLSF